MTFLASRYGDGVSRPVALPADLSDPADVAKGKVVSIPGLQYKMLTAAGRMVPRGLVRAFTKRIGRGRDRT